MLTRDPESEILLMAIVTTVALILSCGAAIGIIVGVAWLWSVNPVLGFVVMGLLGFGLLVVTIAGVLSA